ncbi:MAG: 50S ribosomal protein L22 [Candidatus Melainabacteria bacterium RIFOXYA12_FULL_32_12]|nr:MAG: 50S ribosomal protein L22 [Candidatus Melainabacteria bacterium GWF2_32_7]OGI19203.1 MAG: 50S ribosomal protein L22 [Candidatus Melainabacteria bacterium RIFOXYA2_FULL_32_9]OGI31782.1 MAG: 50S ribosomal protein L22 [Candidatus Melainabacteria bacterium RIFOXYA12_FULL_32_12]
MEAKSKQRYVGMPARKIRRVINEVRGKKVDDAMNILRFMPYAAARVIEKNLTAAIANASEKWGASSEGLVISEIYADDGPMYKRARPRAQGRVYKRIRRTSHLTVIVSVNKEQSKTK